MQQRSKWKKEMRNVQDEEELVKTVFYIQIWYNISPMLVLSFQEHGYVRRPTRAF